MSADVLISQLPMMNEYVDGARAYFSASRHPENIADITEATQEAKTDLSAVDKAKIYGTSAIIGFQQGPFNEMLVGLAVGTTLEATDGNVPLAVGAALLTTGVAEGASSHGMAFSLDKLRPAADILGSRYTKQRTLEEIQNSNKKGELARIYGEVCIALSSGATLYEDLRAGGRTIEENKRTANIATVMTTANYGAVTAVVVGGTKGIESMFGVDGLTQRLADLVQNPILFGGLVGALFGGVKLKERHDTMRRIEGKAQEAGVTEEAPVANEQSQHKGIFQRIMNRKSKAAVPVPVCVRTPQEVN